MRRYFVVAALLSTALLQGCAHTPPDDPADPLESINRPIYTFNTKADQYILRPVAHGYVDVVPAFAREGITNFFANLAYPKVIVNDVLQAKFLQGGKDLTRFVVNSVWGIGGLVDVGTRVGLEAHDEDFGQTLGYWGVGTGWYLMLPLLGPSDNRDAVGYAADTFTSPTYWLPGRYDLPKYSVEALKLLNLRANLLGTESLLESQFDPYIFVRTAYLQRRQSLVYDGNPPQENLLQLDDGSDSDTGDSGSGDGAADSTPAAGAASKQNQLSPVP